MSILRGWALQVKETGDLLLAWKSKDSEDWRLAGFHRTHAQARRRNTQGTRIVPVEVRIGHERAER